MIGRWVEFRDGRKHYVGGAAGKGLQPAYAACGHVDVVEGDARPSLLPAVCVRCKAKLIDEESKMQTCSHGLPLQVKCQQCTQEALSRPACYETYWIAGHGCKKPANRCEACAGCAYHVVGKQS